MPTSLDQVAPAPIGDVSTWRLKAEALRSIVRDLFGVSCHTPVELWPRVLAEEDRGTFQLKTVAIDVEQADVMSVYLLLPQGATRLPTVVAVPGTNRLGKDAIWEEGNSSCAVDLVEQGYAVAVPDMICTGQRHPSGTEAYDTRWFQERWPHGTVRGKMAYDVARLVDYLVTLDEVDPSRIACMGHSLGGSTTLLAVILDERIAAGISSCAWIPFQATKNPFFWSNAASNRNLQPRLAQYAIAGKPPPIELAEMLALVAPRPYLKLSATNDFGHDADRAVLAEALDAAVAEAQRVYSLYGRTESLRLHLHESGHRFARGSEERRLVFEWLHETLAAVAQ